jgi:TfoX/Sxy family transcriptional regulator of competence genes
VALDEDTKRAAEDLVEALQPLDARAKAMFGGYCFYVDDKVAGLVCDGRVFVKKSSRDDLLEELAESAPAYPGAKDSWRLPVGLVEKDPDRVRDIVEQVAAVLPAPRKRKA